MGVRSQLFQRVAGVVSGARFADDAAVHGDYRIGGDDNGGGDGASGNQLGLGSSQAKDVFVRRFVGERRFVDSRRNDREGHTRVVKNFGAAWRGGGEDQLH